MKVRDLLKAIADHAADGRAMEDEVLIKINGDVREVSTSYSDGTFILIAGRTIQNT
jgi:hypothetical protein